MQYAQNKQEQVEGADLKSGPYLGQVAYANREAVGNYAYENREVIAQTAYDNREEIGQAAYEN